MSLWELFSFKPPQVPWSWNHRQFRDPDMHAKSWTLVLCQNSNCSYLLQHLSSLCLSGEGGWENGTSRRLCRSSSNSWSSCFQAWGTVVSKSIIDPLICDPWKAKAAWKTSVVSLILPLHPRNGTATVCRLLCMGCSNLFQTMLGGRSLFSVPSPTLTPEEFVIPCFRS